MKSEHRHELKTNELERIASDWGHASERYVQDHTNQLIVAAVVIVALIIGAIYWRMSSGSVDRQGWRALSDAQSTADYGTVADKYSATKVAPWARLREGEAELTSGIRLLFNDREAGRSDLKKAEENFEKLINDKQTPDEVRERALFSLGRCRESLPAKGAGAATINDPAIETYERLLKQFPDSVYKELVEARIAALRTGTAQDFSAWFETQNPKPADRAMPKDLSIPPLPEDFGPTGQTGASKDKSSKDQKPASTSETSKPKAEKPAVTKPDTKSSSSGPVLPNPAAPGSK
jgi:nitrogen fixation-related uncharacterized protein